MRKILFLFVLFLMAMPLGASADVLMGDVNGDGVVNITDVTRTIDYVLKGNATGLILDNADINGDGGVNITDVTGLITVVLTGSSVIPQDNHEWVDLGLPSGTLWATCNVGASSPEGYGSYFAWGETYTKAIYDGFSANDNGGWTIYYKWLAIIPVPNQPYWYYTNVMTKYNSDTYDNNDYLSSYSDYKTELDPEDDAAYVNWGSSWRTPTVDQLGELSYMCTWQETTRNGVSGFLGTGYNGNTIFFPASGICYGGIYGTQERGSVGYYWTREILQSNCHYAFFAVFGDQEEIGCYPSPSVFHRLDVYDATELNSRFYGFTVRAVRVSQN